MDDAAVQRGLADATTPGIAFPFASAPDVLLQGPDSPAELPVSAVLEPHFAAGRRVLLVLGRNLL